MFKTDRFENGLVIAGLMIMALVAVASAVHAGMVTTAKASGYALRDSQSKVIAAAAEFNALPAEVRTQDACVAAATKIGVGDYRCTTATTVAVTANCDDVPKPEVHVVLNAAGFLERPGLKVEAKSDGSWGPTMEEGYVPAPPPVCWVPGLVPYKGEWNAPEGPPKIEPTAWIDGVDFPAGAECPKEAPIGCILQPNKPKVAPAGCVSEFCVTG